jgi:transposase
MILAASRRVRVFAYPKPVYLRKGFDGLYGLVTHAMGYDVLGGDVFLFVNRCRKSCKVLVWDGTGLCIFQKRLLCGAPHKSRYAEPVLMRGVSEEGVGSAPVAGSHYA